MAFSFDFSLLRKQFSAHLRSDRIGRLVQTKRGVTSEIFQVNLTKSEQMSDLQTVCHKHKVNKLERKKKSLRSRIILIFIYSYNILEKKMLF